MQKELMRAAVARGVRQDVSAKDWKFDVDLRARFGEATECTQSAFETEYAEDLSAACSFSNVGTAFVMKFKTNAAQAGALCSSELQLLRDRCTPACCEKLRDLYSAEAQQNVAEGRTGRKMQLSSDLGKSKLSQEPSCTVGAYKRELAKPASSWNAEGPTIQTSGAVFKAALSREISAFGTAIDKIDISRYVSSKPHSLWDAVLPPSERSSLKSSLRASLHFRVVAEAEVDSLLKRGYASAACLDDATVFASGTCLHTLEGLWEKNDIASPEKLLTVHKDRYRVSVIKSLSFAPHYCPSSQQKVGRIPTCVMIRARTMLLMLPRSLIFMAHRSWCWLIGTSASTSPKNQITRASPMLSAVYCCTRCWTYSTARTSSHSTSREMRPSVNPEAV